MPVRSLADDLRGRSDDQLGRLLAGRPDLLHPVPADMTALASRAGSAVSTSRALDRLDGLALAVAAAVAEAEPCGVDTILSAFDEGLADDVVSALGTLRELALVWGDEDSLRLVRTARESLTGASSSPVVWPPSPVETIERDARIVERIEATLIGRHLFGIRLLVGDEEWSDHKGQADNGRQADEDDNRQVVYESETSEYFLNKEFLFREDSTYH